MSMNGTEQAITNDILTALIPTAATSIHLGKGKPTTVSAPAQAASNATLGNDSVVISYADNSKYRVTVKVEQLNTTTGRN